MLCSYPKAMPSHCFNNTYFLSCSFIVFYNCVGGLDYRALPNIIDG